MLKKFSFIVALFLFCGTAFADTQKETFDRTVKYLDAGGLHFQYQRLENLDVQLRFLLDFCGKANVNASEQQFIYKNFLSALSMIDFNDFQAIGSSTKKLKNNLYANKFFLAVKPQMAAKLNRNVKMRYCANLPVNTIFASGAYFDFAETFAVFEKTFKNNQEFNNFAVMFEQTFGVSAKALAANITGEFFGAVFNGKKNKEKHFLAVIPDNSGMLKNLAARYFGPALRRYNDGSFSWEMPVAATEFGSGVTVYFANKKVVVYNSNAPLKKLFNNDGSVQRLAAAKPDVFGFLSDIRGISYIVINLDVRDICPEGPARNYSYCAFSSYKSDDGYLVDGRSNFNLQDVSEYNSILKILPELQEMFNENEPAEKNPPPMPL